MFMWNWMLFLALDFFFRIAYHYHIELMLKGILDAPTPLELTTYN